MRISKNAFTNLAASMIGFGVLIGLGFPFAVLAVRVPADVAISAGFFVFTVSAGILVGGVNILLARFLVRPRLTLMARRMGEVEAGLKEATYTGDWSRCNPDECELPVDSEDEFGAAAAAFNRLLHALAESHTVEMRIADFTNAMSAELDVAAICQAAIDSFREDLGAAGVAIIGESAGALEVLASYGLSDPESLIESDLVRNAVRSLAADSMSMPEHLVIDAAVARLTPQHVVVYPLVLESAAIGAVVLASSGEVPQRARALGPLFIRTLSVALSNALSHESIRRIASLDPLTGVLNRRSGLDRLHDEFLAARRRDRPLGVVMADIDHFKTVNDGHGHLVGDAVLRRVAGVVGAVLREGDFLVRYGGEEFLAVLPGAGRQVISEIAERIRAAAEEQVARIDGVDVVVTLSAGYATTDESVDDAMDLVAMADEALLVAKRMGRNRAVAAAG
jgi:diguanylate cyclase (GGDEF)-like protein